MADMKKKTVYLETGSTDPAYNLAFEEYILHNKNQCDYMILWQNDNAVIIGRNQNLEQEINKGFIRQHGISVIRRNTGGGAVYHDQGNLNYSFITSISDEGSICIDRFTEIVVTALKKLGLNAVASGRNDICINGKKVSGTAQHLYKKRLLYHGTMLFDSDIDKMTGALNVDREKFESKGVNSIVSRVGNIRDCLSKDMTMTQFWNYLKKNMMNEGLAEEFITKEEYEKICALKKEKYDSWEWNFGKSPQFTVRNKSRWKGGSIEVGLVVKNGRIEDIAIYGDFLALSPIDETISRLKGRKFLKKDILEALEGENFKEVFGEITKTELINTIFQE